MGLCIFLSVWPITIYPIPTLTLPLKGREYFKLALLPVEGEEDCSLFHRSEFHQIRIPSLPVRRKNMKAAPKSKATWTIVNAAIAPTGE